MLRARGGLTLTVRCASVIPFAFCRFLCYDSVYPGVRLGRSTAMLTSVTGVYRNGQITLTEQPSNLPDEAQVIVTFLATPVIDLATRGIDQAQAADLRARLQMFAA